jgi:hypothetical protein
MKSEASSMAAARIQELEKLQEVTKQHEWMARWLLCLHRNCRNRVLRAVFSWWRLWRCGVPACSVWLSTTFLFPFNHSQILGSPFFIKHLEWVVPPHNPY